jgi:hypothetical protein
MTLRLNGSTSGFTEIDCPAVGGSNTLVLPTGNGSSGQVLTTNGSGALSWSGMGPAFSAYQSSSLSIPDITFTKITFNTEEFDTANCFASSRFTPNIAGYYQFNGAINIAATSTNGVSLVSFYKNGSEFKRGSQIPNTSNNVQPASSAFIYLNGSSDYVELYTLHNNGGTRTTGTGQSEIYFQGFLARPA